MQPIQALRGTYSFGLEFNLNLQVSSLTSLSLSYHHSITSPTLIDGLIVKYHSTIYSHYLAPSSPNHTRHPLPNKQWIFN